MNNASRQSLLLALALFILTIIAYLPALNAGYIWDDDDYLTQNSFIESPTGIVNVWQPMQTRQYYPLVFSSFWIEHKIWGYDPLGYHLVNILLHALSATLIWRIAKWLKLPGAWVIAAVFALHPVHVESVAWITERKNTLSGACYLLAMLTYLKFDAQRRDGVAPWWRYALACVCFAAALFAKSVTASLPIAIVIVLLLKREKLSLRRLWPLLPMLALGVAMGLNTAHVEHVNVGAVGPDFDFSWTQRCLIASRALLFYPMKLLVPWPLCFFYPRWVIAPGNVLAYWPVAVVLVIAALLIWLWVRGARWPACAAMFFAVTIAPALGFVSVYPMKYSFVADHFQYLASLGIIAGVVAPLAWLLRAKRWRWLAAAGVLALLGTLTIRQTFNYQDEETLWRATIRCNPGAWMAMNNLGGELLVDAQELQRQGREDAAKRYVAEAESLLREALRLKPDHDAARAQLSEALRVQGHLKEALAEMEQSHADLLASLRWMNEAQRQRSAWEIAESHYRLARLYNMLGSHDEAIQHYRDAIGSYPKFPTALLELAQVLAADGRLDEAAATYNNLLQIQPNVITAHEFLGDYERDHKHWALAVAHYRAVFETSDDQGTRLRAMDRAARILATCPDDAVRDGALAVRLAEAVCQATNRQFVFPLQTLAAAYAETGRFPEAINTAEAALAIAATQPEMQDVVTQLHTELALYKAGEPWRVD